MFRRYVWRDDSRPLPHVVALVFLFISLVLLGMLALLAHGFVIIASYLVWPIRWMAVITLVTFVGVVWTWRNRERISWLEVPDMSVKAEKRAKRLLKLFSDKAITDVLGFSVSTRYGEEMPVVRVWVNDDLNLGYIAVENIANFDALDRQKLEHRVSGILSGRYAKYAVVASDLTVGDAYVRYWFEDVATSHRLTVSNGDVSPFVSSNVHEIQVMDNLKLRFGYDVHNMGIVARTRSGKTMLAKFMASVMVQQGWIVEYSSAKHDVNVDQFNGYSDPLDIVDRAEYWVSVMNERLRRINESGREKYLDMPDMVDVALFWDELGNLSAALDLDKKAKSRWQAAINRLTATGASAGIHSIGISQMATLEGLGLPNLARTNLADSVIMLGEAANNSDERRYMMSGYADLPSRHYGVGQGLAKFTGIGGIWATPHLFETPYFE